MREIIILNSRIYQEYTDPNKSSVWKIYNR